MREEYQTRETEATCERVGARGEKPHFPPEIRRTEREGVLEVAGGDEQRFGGSELVGDDWERNVDRLGDLAAELGITYNQSHAPFDSNLYRPEIKLSDEYRAWYA